MVRGLECGRRGVVVWEGWRGVGGVECGGRGGGVEVCGKE